MRGRGCEWLDRVCLEGPVRIPFFTDGTRQLLQAPYYGFTLFFTQGATTQLTTGAQAKSPRLTRMTSLRAMSSGPSQCGQLYLSPVSSDPQATLPVAVKSFSPSENTAKFYGKGGTFSTLTVYSVILLALQWLQLAHAAEILLDV